MQAQAAIRKAVEDAKLGGGGRKDAGLGRLKLLQIVCRLARPRLNLVCSGLISAPHWKIRSEN